MAHTFSNQDIGILFDPDSKRIREKALGHFILSILEQKENRKGLTIGELYHNLKTQYNWPEAGGDKIKKVLDFLQNSENGNKPLVRLRLRYPDGFHVYRATEDGIEKIKTARTQGEDLEETTKNSIKEIIHRQLNQLDIQEDIIKELVDIFRDDLIRKSFESAKTVLAQIEFSKNDIGTFTKYHAETLAMKNKQALRKRKSILYDQIDKENNNLLQDVKKAVTRIKNAINRQPPDAIEQFIHAYTYNALLFVVLPYISNTSINKYLQEKMKQTKLCFDTTTLMSLLLEGDRDYSTSREIVRTLKVLGVQVFWHDLAEVEMHKKFKRTREAVDAIKALPLDQRLVATQMVSDDGYLNTFFQHNYISTNHMEAKVRERLKASKTISNPNSIYARSNGTNFLSFDKVHDKINKMGNDIPDNYSKVRDKISALVDKKFDGPTGDSLHKRHDREILEWVYGLRFLSSPQNKGSNPHYLANYWVVTGDYRLIDNERKHLPYHMSPQLRQPLTLALKSLQLLLDPAEVMQAIERSTKPNTNYLMELEIIDDCKKSIKGRIANIQKAKENPEKIIDSVGNILRSIKLINQDIGIS